jgi:hypothetical protein
MDPISKLNRLLETLRIQQSAPGNIKARKSESSERTEGSRNHSHGNDTSHVKVDAQQLRRNIGERIALLSLEEREGDKAVQVLVDSVLAWKFGEDLLQSQHFSHYSEKIRGAIKQDADLSHEFSLFLKSLAQPDSANLY